MGRHVPGTTWPIRRVGTYPQVYVDTDGPERVKVLHFGWLGDSSVAMILARRDARLRPPEAG